MEEKKKIIILGGGGHSKVLIEIIRMSEDLEIQGILDASLEAGTLVAGVSVLGGDELMPSLNSEGVRNACIAVGSIKDNSKRDELFKTVKRSGFSVPRLIHPRAVVSGTDTEIAEGVQIMAGAVVQAGTIVGENTIINTGAVVEHDCVVGKNVHICPGAIVCGGSVIGDNAFVGAGATIIQGIEIGSKAIIGAGAVVLKNVLDGAKVKGAV